jgi:hypothetical protein
MIVVAVEEAPLLLTVHRIVCSVEVQDQAFRGTAKRGDELLDEHLVQPPGRGPVGAVLPATQRRGAGQWRVAFNRRLDRQIVAQCLMVVEIFVTECQPVQPLAHHAWQVMRAAGVAA